jgi:hypothetical protein
MGHAVQSILSGDGTHPMPAADRSPFIVGNQELTDEKQLLPEGTKFRIYGFPSELSNGPASTRLAQYGKITKATKTEKSHAKPQSRKDSEPRGGEVGIAAEDRKDKKKRN